MKNINDNHVKQNYNDYLKELSTKRIRLAVLYAIILVPAGSFFDYFIYPQFFKLFFLIRISSTMLFLIVYFMSYFRFWKDHSIGLGVFSAELVALPIIIMIQIAGGYNSPYYAGLNLIILAVGVVLPWGIKSTLISCVLIYSSYLLPIFLFNKIEDIGLFINNNYFLSFTMIIALISNYVASKLRYREFIGRFKLNEAYEQLKGLDELKTQFFSNISHELRTPLTLVLAPTESILKGEAGNLTTQAHNLVETIHSNTLRLLKLINNLLDLSKIDAGKMSVSYEKLELNEFIKGIIAEISHIAEKKNLSLEFNEGKDIPPFCFEPDKIEKVLLNIIYNSIKFTDKGGKIIITTHKENNNAVVKIIDTGIGIEEKDMEKIFDRFVQVDGSQRRRYEGTGIGLPLAKELVELHKGRIQAESEIGKGTSITFTLPLVLEYGEKQSSTKEDDWTKTKYRESIYSTADIIKPVREEKQSIKPSIDSKKILVVEDNLDMLNLISFQLEKEYMVFKACDGKEGLETVQREMPDLIIADIMMPLMDGYELCQKIKNNDRTKHIPLIFLTAKAGLDMKIEGLEKGADEYLVKPFNAGELRTRVRSLLNLRKLEREIQERSEELERTLKQLKETQTQLVHSEKMASLGQLVAGIAHEMNNPISAALHSSNAIIKQIERSKTGKENLNDDAAKRDLEETAHLLRHGLSRASNIIADLRTFVKKDVSGMKESNIHEGLDSTLHILHSRLEGKNVTIHKNYMYSGKVECSLGLINQVFMNILQNSIDAVSEKGQIWITTESDGSNVKIIIKDNGAGIKKENLSRVFDPFFTTKDVGEGIGLGLSISYSIIKEHQGTIEINSEEGKETEVEISLPIRQRRESK